MARWAEDRTVLNDRAWTVLRTGQDWPFAPGREHKTTLTCHWLYRSFRIQSSAIYYYISLNLCIPSVRQSSPAQALQFQSFVPPSPHPLCNMYRCCFATVQMLPFDSHLPHAPFRSHTVSRQHFLRHHHHQHLLHSTSSAPTKF